MNEVNKKLLTPFEVTALLIGVMADISLASLPNAVVKVCKQDGWIAAFLWVVYPLYVIAIAIFISGRFPKENILALSKKYLGNIVGGIFNFLFFLSFFSFFPSIISNVNDILIIYVVPFLKPLKIYIVTMLVGAYAAYKGGKVLARICLLNMFLLLSIFVMSLAILKYGSILNIMPVFGTGFKAIIKGAPKATFQYAGLEVIFLIYPMINDSKKIKSASLKAIVFMCFLYTWIVFISIYYMGSDIIPKTIWGFFYATEAIRIEVMHTFRYVFIFLWVLIGMKSISIFYYICIFILNDIHKAIGNKLSYGILGIIAIIITRLFFSDRLRGDIIAQYAVKLSVGFNIVYITFIALIIFIKRDGKGAIK